MIKDMTIQQFLDELASSAPTPGGGGAAAIMGAMGAALVSMVCNLTLGKKNYEQVQEEMRDTLAKSEALRSRLTAMIQDDAQVFDQVMGAYGLPKETDEQKTTRSAAIQSALKLATDVPLECARACAEVVKLSRVVAEKGNKNVVSDAGVAVMAGYAGLKSAALNVYINVGAIKDEGFVDTRTGDLKVLLSGLDLSTDEIYDIVKNNL